jgi:hypothetical protein
MISKISKFENVAIVFPVYADRDHYFLKRVNHWSVIFNVREEPIPYTDIRLRHNIKHFYTKEEAILQMESMGQTIRILDFEVDLGHFKLCGTLRDWWDENI